MKLSKRNLGLFVSSTALAIVLHQANPVQALACANPENNSTTHQELALNSEYVLHRLFTPNQFRA